MKTSSAKAKGRRLQDHVVKELMSGAYNNCEECEEHDHPMWTPRKGDIKPAIMGESGTDIKLSPAAKDHIPFDIECKNTERASVWQWIKQAEENAEEGRVPLTVFKRNRSDVYAIIKLDDLLKLL